MSKNAISHGIEKIQFTNAPADGVFPASTVFEGQDSDTLRTLRAIKINSFSESKDNDETTDIEVEDVEGAYVTLQGKEGKETIEVESYDMSDEALKYFMGYKTYSGDDTNLNGYIVQPVHFSVPPQCMRVLDRKLAGKSRREWLYMPCIVKGVISGQRTKTELRSVKLTITLGANFDSKGNQIPNKASKIVE